MRQTNPTGSTADSNSTLALFTEGIVNIKHTSYHILISNSHSTISRKTKQPQINIVNPNHPKIWTSYRDGVDAAKHIYSAHLLYHKYNACSDYLSGTRMRKLDCGSCITLPESSRLVSNIFLPFPMLYGYRLCKSSTAGE